MKSLTEHQLRDMLIKAHDEGRELGFGYGESYPQGGSSVTEADRQDRDAFIEKLIKEC